MQSWRYRSRQHLLLWLAGSRPDAQTLAGAAARKPEVQAERAVLLVVLHGPVEQAEQLRTATGLRGPVLADADGGVHRRLAADAPTLFVVGRNGTIYWRAPCVAGRPDLDEALSWLAYLNILEPECGTCVPAWPVD